MVSQETLFFIAVYNTIRIVTLTERIQCILISLHTQNTMIILSQQVSNVLTILPGNEYLVPQLLLK
jgi:hypothetical protein